MQRLVARMPCVLLIMYTKRFALASLDMNGFQLASAQVKLIDANGGVS